MQSSTPSLPPAGGPGGTSARPGIGQRLGRLRFILRTSGVWPALRLGLCLLTLAVSAATGALGDRFVPAQRRGPRREARHQRAVWRLAAALGDLKGAFVKVGQFASLRYDVLPAPLRAGLASLRENVPPLPYPLVRATVEAELGAPIKTLFHHFEAVPLGAASVAQVHRAELPDGTQVAVKVRYPWLERSLAADLRLVRWLLRGWCAWTGRPDLARGPLFDEFAAGLREELDFEREAAVASEIAANLAGHAQIVVPRVFASHSSRGVLTMSYQPAVRIGDRAGLARLGAQPAHILEVLARAYAKQVFADGLFHADPHPGNLFVLEEAAAAERPRVLFVDFGLCRRLDPALRRELRQGIYALLQSDLEGFVAGMDRMGMIAPGAEGSVRNAVKRMLERIRSGGGALGVGGSQVLALKDEAKALLQQTEGLRLPNDLLLYAKTLSYLFALGQELDPNTDLMKLSLPYLLQFLAGRD